MGDGVAWAALSIDARNGPPIRPIVFIHGFTGNVQSLEQFEENATVAGIPSAIFDMDRGIHPFSWDTVLLQVAITNARKAFGVDKVDIVAHSKGGVTSRLAIQTFQKDVADHVAHLFTLSSPHHGHLLTRIIPLNNCNLLKDLSDQWNLCLQAADEQRENMMRLRNFDGCESDSFDLSTRTWHWEGCRPKFKRQSTISYISMVGGPTDVGATATYPWDSLAWINNQQPFPTEKSVDAEFSAYGHSGIASARDVYDCIISFIEPRFPGAGCTGHETNSTSGSASRSAVSVAAQAPSPAPIWMSGLEAYRTILSTSGSLAATSIQTVTTSVESTSLSVLSVISTEPLDFTLIDPSGQIISPNVVANDPDITYIAQPDAGFGSGWLYQYQIRNPTVGTWQSVLQTTNAAYFGVLNVVDSPVQLHVNPDHLMYRPGDLITVEALLADDTTLLSGNLITGTLELPDSTPVALDFYDDGTHGDVAAADGRYAAQTTAANVTGYATITVNAIHGDVSRIATETIAIAAQSAQFRSAASETATDEDGDHLYDSLNLTISMTTVISGHFGITGDLVDAGGQPVASASASTRMVGVGPLNPGDHAALLAFDGETIRKSGLSGPYTLTDLRITDETTGTFEVDLATNVYTTTTYQPSQFEGPQLTLLGGTEAPIDTDGDTLANQLNVQLDLNIIFPGEYAWSGRLLDGQGAQIGWANGAGQLDNQTPLTLSFDGQDIRNHGQNGPYVVSDVAIYQTDGGNAAASFGTAYTTAAYDRLTFDVNACIDMHEPDNTDAQSQSFALGETQTHAFCMYDDQDWVTFTADAGVPYRIETLNPASGVDTVLELYTGDGQTLLQSNDNGNADLTSRITFMPSISGAYLVKAHPKEPAGDPSFTYDVRIGPLPLPTLTVDSAAAATNENGGTVAVTARLSATFAYTVTVDYATNDETATVDTDYTATPGTLTFAPGETSKTVLVPILEDVLGESDETFGFSLSSPDNAILGEPAHTTITVLANDTVSFSTASYSAQENAGMATVTVKLNAPSSQPVKVHYATSDGTATAGDDYTATSGILTFAPGRTSRTFKIPITDDTTSEVAETILLSLSNPSNAAIGALESATLTIKANDTLVFSASSANVQEATDAITMTVKLNAPAGHPVMVDYMTIDGTATAGSDYTPISGTLTFAPGEIKKTVTISILDDPLGEPNETFGLSLSSPTNAALGTPANATITIKANDTLTLSASTYRVSEYDGIATITVKLNAPSSQPVTVEYATNDGTAIAEDDYTATSGTLTFSPGETRQTFTIPIYYDFVHERNETVQLVVRNPSNAGLGTPATATLTITNASGGGT
jgi:hypothetical protein